MMIRTTLYVLGLVSAVSGAAVLTAKKNSASAQRARLSSLSSAAARIDASGALPRVHIDAARGFNHSSALLAFSALTDSAVEHYRGSFENPAMVTPLVCATCALLAGLHGGRDRTAASHSVRHAIYLAAAAAGVAGSAFHLYN